MNIVSSRQLMSTEDYEKYMEKESRTYSFKFITYSNNNFSFYTNKNFV